MHRFRSSASPIKGLTSDILVRCSVDSSPTPHTFIYEQIHAAEIAFARDTTYPRWAPGQPGTFAEIASSLDDCEERKEASTASSQVAR
jgi:hypothetical protein